MDREKEILQIRKYLNGELNARAMHELERRALDDPFLTDAMEGFEQAGDQHTNLNELKERLHERIHDKKVKRLIPWMPLSIAASILIILSAGIWFFSGQQTVQPKLIAQDIKSEKKEQPVVSSPSSATPTVAEKDISDTMVKAKQLQPKQYTAAASAGNSKQQIAAADVKSNAAAEPAPVLTAEQQAAEIYKPKKDSVTADEMAVNATRQKKSATVLNEVTIAKDKAPSAETLVQSRAQGVTVTPSDSKMVTGVVMGPDGQPIIGATVKVMGRPFGVVTDVHGKFALTDVSKDQTLAVNYIGYEGKKVKIGAGDSLNINLAPQSSSLNEVVVTGYSVKKDDSDNEGTIEDPHPSQGWHAYNEYLKKNAQSPDGKTGKVKVSVTVAPDGSLSEFKIVKSLSDAADKKATDLITNGPSWVGGSDGKAKEVKVSVSFK